MTRPRSARFARSARLLALLLLGAATAPAQDAAPVASTVRLEYRLDRLAGKLVTSTLETEQVVGQELRGQDGGEVKSWTRVTIEQRFEAPGAEGLARVVMTTRRVQARLEEAGRSARYDSQDGGTAGPFAPLADRVGKAVTLEVARTGEVRKVRGVPSSERGQYQDAFLVLPEKPLDVGDGWDRLDRKPMDPLGTLVYHFRYALGAVEPERRRVDATIRARFEPGLPSAQASVEVTDQRGAGSVAFDPDGVVLESDLETRLVLTIKTPSGTQVQRLVTRTKQALVSIEDAPAAPAEEPKRGGRGKR